MDKQSFVVGYRLMPALAISALDLKQNRRFIYCFCANVSIPDGWLGHYRASTWNGKGRRRASARSPMCQASLREVDVLLGSWALLSIGPWVALAIPAPRRRGEMGSLMEDPASTWAGCGTREGSWGWVWLEAS